MFCNTASTSSSRATSCLRPSLNTSYRHSSRVKGLSLSFTCKFHHLPRKRSSYQTPNRLSYNHRYLLQNCNTKFLTNKRTSRCPSRSLRPKWCHPRLIISQITGTSWVVRKCNLHRNIHRKTHRGSFSRNILNRCSSIKLKFR